VVTLDLDMPEMDGLEALSLIMRECPTPVVAISGVSGRAATQTLQALDLGAVDFVLKYSPGVNLHPVQLQREILSKVRAASRIHVVRSLGRMAAAAVPSNNVVLTAHSAPPAVEMANSLVIVGASTGGPLAVRELLSALPPDFPAPIIVVQHMPKSFTAVLAVQLGRHCRLRVRETGEEDRLTAGLALVAHGGYHLLLRPGFRVTRCPDTASSAYCPSIDVAMESAARIYGSRVLGVLLTGMGEDGAAGLQIIRDKGGVTFAQDAESCVVDGMPRRARERGAVDHVAPPRGIAQMLIEEMERRRTHAA
jgi:two-component system, chemotaxis family, protein-glutamate methylesterase/glutaminase